ncbi:hypothetical protein GGR53DRAFT_528082 [Hypoxylon sp. FL1150]|nr:hypothetical protein GGR53DRAFT_528082 [Hypoxylon sp. FL1150]
MHLLSTVAAALLWSTATLAAPANPSVEIAVPPTTSSSSIEKMPTVTPAPSSTATIVLDADSTGNDTFTEEFLIPITTNVDPVIITPIPITLPSIQSTRTITPDPSSPAATALADDLDDDITFSPATASVGPQQLPGPPAAAALELADETMAHSPFCNRSFDTGPKLDALSVFLMGECWKDIKRGERGWVLEWCRKTHRNFLSNGWHWRNPEHCYRACDGCMSKGIADGMSGVQCFAAAGPMAWCSVDYQRDPRKHWGVQGGGGGGGGGGGVGPDGVPMALGGDVDE